MLKRGCQASGRNISHRKLIPRENRWEGERLESDSTDQTGSTPGGRRSKEASCKRPESADRNPKYVLKAEKTKETKTIEDTGDETQEVRMERKR